MKRERICAGKTLVIIANNAREFSTDVPLRPYSSLTTIFGAPVLIIQWNLITDVSRAVEVFEIFKYLKFKYSVHHSYPSC